MKTERMKVKQQDIAIKKLEKEALMRKRNEELMKKWEILEKFEIDYRKEVYAKSIQMRERREAKIRIMKQLEK